MELTITKRIILGIFSIILAFSIISFLAIQGINSIVHDANNVMFGNEVKGILVQKTVDHLNWLNKLSSFIMNEKVKNFKGQTDPTKCSLAKWLNSSNRLLAEKRYPGISSIIAKLEDVHTKFHHSAVQIKRHKAEGNISEAQNVYNTVTVPNIRFVQQYFNELINEVKENTTTEKKMVSNASTFRNITIYALLIMVICGIILSFFISKSIVAPLVRISETIRSSSENMLITSDELSNASQSLAHQSSNQASSIEETSASLEELSGILSSNAGGAPESVTLAEQVKDVSLKGGQAVNALIDSMNEILKSNSRIQELVSVIGEIGEKTAIIDEIVFQTKLLSFNASVEAERAGEHGRGFAVVAQEVGNLAQMSGSAALEISAIVKNSIDSAKSITTENKAKVVSGNELVQESAKILEEIKDKAMQVTSEVKSIQSATQEQSHGINEINSSVALLDKATQENAATSEQTARSSEKLTEQARMLSEVVTKLSVLIRGA